MNSNPVIGPDLIQNHTATNNNEAATAKAMDLIKNYVGFVRCLVHMMTLVVTDVLKPQLEWQTLMDIVNCTTTYSRNHTKASIMFRKIQLKEGVTNDRIQSLLNFFYTVVQ